MDSGEFRACVVKIAKICVFPCTNAEEGAIRDTIFLGMNSTWARDKAINFMNEERKEHAVEFLMNLLGPSCYFSNIDMLLFIALVAVAAGWFHWGMLCEVHRDHTGSYVLSQ